MNRLCYFFAILSLWLTLPALAAPTCPLALSKDPIMALYNVHQSDQGSWHTLIYLRNQQQILWIEPERAMSQLWFRASNQQIGMIRYFDAQQRAIEYPVGEANISAERWPELSNLITEPMRQQLTLAATIQTNCGIEQHLTGNYRQQDISVNWLVDTHLVTAMTVRDGEHTQEWQLQTVHNNAQEIQQLIALRQAYQSTDYADIGDSESDPFLAKMIHLGFIQHGHNGAYDSQGHPLKSAHGH